MKRLDVLTTAPAPLEDEFGAPEDLDLMIDIMVEQGEEVPERWIQLVNEWRLNNDRPVRSDTFHLKGTADDHDQQSHAGGGGSVDDDYHGGHRPTDTGPRIHDLWESEATDGLDVYDNPQFYTAYSGPELAETIRQLRKVRGNPEATVTIYRAAPKGAEIRDGDWVTLSKRYAKTHLDSGNAGDDPVILEREVPAKEVRWAVDDLMEFGWFPSTADEHHREFAAFHLRGTQYDHDQSTHGGRGGTGTVDSPDDAYQALRSGKPTTLRPEDVPDVVARIGADDDGVVDLSNLTIDGYALFQPVKGGPRTRETMPQVPEAQIDNFQAHLKEAGIAVTPGIADPTTLLATQNELDATKVGQMVTKMRLGTFRLGHPPWVSNDGYILDGHHRWASFAIMEAAGLPHPPMDVMNVDLSITELLAIADHFNDLHDVQSKAIHMAVFLAQLGYGVERFHLKGSQYDHDQSTHGGGGGGQAALLEAGMANTGARYESDREIWEHPSKDRLAIVTADGTVIYANGDTTTVGREWPGFRQTVVDALNGVADAYEAAPTSTVPKVLVTKEDRVDAFAFVDPKGRFYDQHEIVLNLGGGADGTWQDVYATDGDVSAVVGDAYFMPAALDTSFARYVGAHEYGHVRAALGDDDEQWFTTVHPVESGQGDDERTDGTWSEMSEYARTDPAEAHAEAFAEWVVSGGKTDNGFARAYADIFGWGDDDRRRAIAASGGIRFADIDILGDSLHGPVYHFKDGDEFHLKGTEHDHDQQTHAPGGSGGGADDPGIRSDGEPFPFDSVTALADQYDDGTHDRRFKHEGAARVAVYMGEEAKQEIADELNKIRLADLPPGVGPMIGADLETDVAAFGLDATTMPLGVAMQAASLARLWAMDYPNYETGEKFQAAVDAYTASGDAAALSAAIDELGISVAHGAIDWRNAQWQQSAVTPAMVAFHLQAASTYDLGEASRALRGYYPSGPYEVAEQIRRMMPTTIGTILDADRFAVEDAIQMSVRRDSRATVTIYRGVKYTGHQGTNYDDATVAQSNPLASWSVDRNEALNFAGVHSTDGGWLIEAEVPVNQIIAMSTVNGWGSLREREVIVMGKPTPIKTVTPVNRERRS